METQIIMESNNEEETKMLDRNVMLCNCKQVSYADVEDAVSYTHLTLPTKLEV